MSLFVLLKSAAGAAVKRRLRLSLSTRPTKNRLRGRSKSGGSGSATLEKCLIFFTCQVSCFHFSSLQENYYKKKIKVPSIYPSVHHFKNVPLFFVLRAPKFDVCFTL